MLQRAKDIFNNGPEARSTSGGSPFYLCRMLILLMPAKRQIIDIFASSEKSQNVQLSIAGILPVFRAGRRRLLRHPPYAQSQRTKTPPPCEADRGGKTAFILSAISWLQSWIFKSLSHSETFLRRIAAENVHDHPVKPSRRFGQMILKVWVNDPERLTKPSGTFSRENTVLPPNLRASKRGTVL
ncbi:MAG: hypothetical protein IIT98_07565 [Kiritimatiellae bacterium]|nr:hypothetical protein [Kiritimatiellia bacterium]